MVNLLVSGRVEAAVGMQAWAARCGTAAIHAIRGAHRGDRLSDLRVRSAGAQQYV